MLHLFLYPSAHLQFFEQLFHGIPIISNVGTFFKKYVYIIRELAREREQEMLRDGKKPTALSIPRRSPIQVLTQPYVA